MAKPTATKRIFNLLKPYQPPQTAWDKVYDWLLGRARVVMVVAEIAVAIAFISKVAIDVRAKDLDERISASDFELSRFAIQAEPEIRQLQQKANSYERVWDRANAYGSILDEVVAAIPNLSANLNIRIDGNQLTIRADDDISALSAIESALKNSPSFARVEVTNLSSAGGEVESGAGRTVLTAVFADVISRPELGSENNAVTEGQQ